MRFALTLLILASQALAQDVDPNAAEPAAKPALLAHVEQRGDGPVPMILIPSYWCDWSVWDEFMTRNAERYTMYAVTLPGNGGTEPPAFPDDRRDFASMQWTDLAAKGVMKLIKNESLQDVVLVGHHAGGQLAMRLAIEHPSIISHVVNIDGEPATPLRGPSGMPTREERDLIVNRKMGAERVSDDIWRGQIRRITDKLVTNPGRAGVLGDMMTQPDFETGRRYYLEYQAEDLTDRLRGLATPALVIAPISPDLDDIDANRLQSRWTSLFADVDAATIEFFYQCRQFVMFDEPEKLDEAIAEFLEPAPEPAPTNEIVSP